ncbi:MAG: NAD-dependent epimerase/dehydratase family protein, partial [Pseudobdellovibrio sp.]
MKFLITGVTGLIGQELCLRLLKEGHEVYGITRQKNFALLPQKNVINLDLESEFPSDIVKGYDVIIHLAGYPVADEYWSASVKEKIKSSRVLATKNLVNALNKLEVQDKPKFFVAGSAIGIYGKGYLADVTRDWEEQSLSVKNV